MARPVPDRRIKACCGRAGHAAPLECLPPTVGIKVRCEVAEFLDQARSDAITASRRPAIRHEAGDLKPPPQRRLCAVQAGAPVPWPPADSPGSSLTTATPRGGV